MHARVCGALQLRLIFCNISWRDLYVWSRVYAYVSISRLEIYAIDACCPGSLYRYIYGTVDQMQTEIDWPCLQSMHQHMYCCIYVYLPRYVYMHMIHQSKDIFCELPYEIEKSAFSLHLNWSASSLGGLHLVCSQSGCVAPHGLSCFWSAWSAFGPDTYVVCTVCIWSGWSASDSLLFVWVVCTA